MHHDDKYHPLTLQFSREREMEYRAEQLHLTRRIVRLGGPALAAITLVGGGILAARLETTPAIQHIITMTTSVLILLVAAAAALAWMPVRYVTRWGNPIGGLIACSIFADMLLAISAYPEARQRFAIGILHFALVFHGMTPYDWRLKTLVNLAVPLVFLRFLATASMFPGEALLQIGAHLVLTASIVSVIGYIIERFAREQWQLGRSLKSANERSEELLLNTLPPEIATRLKAGATSIVDEFAGVTVIFADLVGFTKLAGKVSAAELVEILNDVFSRFDAVVDHYEIEKIKTLGDAYMAAAGLPLARADHAQLAAEVALDMREAVNRYRHISGRDLHVRIGVASGPVIAGIIGRKKFLYDLWGDAVNVASRMESQGVAGEIQVSETTRFLLGDAYEFEDRGEIEIKGKGKMRTWILKRPASAVAPVSSAA